MHIRNILLLLFLGFFYTIPAEKPELFLLSVGVAQYQDAALNLDFCADDARDLAKALQAQTDLYQVMETKVLTDAQANRAAVSTKLDLFKKKVTANDLFVFVFSGHGIEDALVPYDFDINDPSATSLLKGDLRSKLNGLGCNYIVLLDACHSGSFTKQVNGKDIRNGDAFALSVEQASQQLAEALGSTDKNAIVVSSSASNQLSYECPGVKGIASRKGCPDPTQPSNAETITDTTVGIFILVKGGTFQMGNALQVPIHSVTLSDYYIGQTEVTQAQWRAVMGENPSGYGHCDACPVEQVSWERIQAFLTKLNNRSGGNKYRLPTEAEWEYAARGGKQSKGYTYSGSNDIDAVAWYDKNAGGKSHPIKGKTANELGLYDMSGNVLEWCSDWYGSYSSAFQTNPTGATSGSLRVYRDGSWYSGPEFCVVAYRGYGSPDLRGPNLGFRLAMAVTF